MKRIQRLQTVIQPIPPPKPLTEEDREFSATIERLLQRMDPAHVRLVLADFNAVGSDSSKQHCKLTVAVFERAYNHLKKNQPLQLPIKVAALEMIDEGFTNYNCEDCGYDLPSNWPVLDANSPRSSRYHFEPCPLCGGKVGWHAYYSKHKCYREQVPLSPEQTLPDAMEAQ
jgi:hypothetical protein